MNSSTTQRQHLIEAINTLPDECLIELVSYVDYLRYKSAKQQQRTKSNAAFLLCVAGLGDSGENNVSERDEEILSNEVNPINGWSLNSDEQV